VKTLTRRELGLAALVLLLLAYIGFGSNFFGGETIAPMDLLAEGQGYSEGMPALAMGSPQKTDILDGLLPSWRFARSELRHGRLPWWNPVFTGGAPSLSSLFEGFVTPRFLLYVLLPEPWGYGLGLVVQTALAGLGAFLFCRRRLAAFPALLGAVTFMFCGFNDAWAQWQHVATASMIPWMLWALAGVLDEPGPRSAGILGICVALVLYGGFPAVAAYAFCVATFLAVAVVARRIRERGQLQVGLRIAGYAALGVALGLGLTIWQLAPSLEFLRELDLSYRQSYRGAGLAPGQIRWLLSPMLGAKAPVEDAAYVGVMPWLLLPVVIHFALVRRRPWPGAADFGVASPVFWLATLGVVLGIRYRFPARLAELAYALPILRTNPNMRLTSIIGLAMAVLAALGGQALLGWVRPSLSLLRTYEPRTVVFAPMIAGAILALHFADVSRLVRYHNGRIPAGRFLPETPLIADGRQHLIPGQSVMATYPTFMSAGTLGSYGFVEFFRHDFRRPSDQTFLDNAMKSRWSLLTSANFDLERIKLDSPWLIPLSVRYVFTSTVPAYAAWQHEVTRFAEPNTDITQEFVIGPRQGVCALALVTAWDSPRREGSLRVEVRRTSGTVVSSTRLPLQQLRNQDWTYVGFPEVDLAGTYSLVLSTSADTQGRIGVVTSNGDTQPGSLVISGAPIDGDLALRIEHCRPALPEHWRVAREGAGTLLLENTAAAPGATLLDAKAWDADPAAANFDVKHVEVAAYRADHRTYDVTAATDAFLIASIRSFEGWTATVDTAPAEMRAYRGFLVSVAVPPGTHRVELRYAPPREGRYGLISLAALLACILLLWHRFKETSTDPWA
jgi:hypothetical protein